VPAEVKKDLEFVFVQKMEQVLEAALVEMPKPRPAEAAAPAPAN
jgi:ATP-dependent Lon protease